MKKKYTKEEIVVSLLFSIFETLSIFLVSYLIWHKSLAEMLSVCILFFIPRMTFKGASHYKNPLKCYFISLFLGVSMIGMYSVHEMLGYCTAIFSGLVLTGVGDITNLYQLATEKFPNDIDYKIVYKWVRMNQNDCRIIAFEENLKRNAFNYTIYRNVFLGYETKENTAFDLVFSQSNYLDKHIARIIGRLEQIIPEIKDLNN